MKWLIPILLIALFSGCSDGADLSYHIGWDATPEEQEDITYAFNMWSNETGIPTGEREYPSLATFRLSLGDPTTDCGGYKKIAGCTITDWDWELRPDGSYRERLQQVRMTLDPEFRDKTNTRRFLLLHEVGHGYNLKHNQDCRSIMQTDTTNSNDPDVQCMEAPFYIDDQSLAQAMETVRAGWFD